MRRLPIGAEPQIEGGTHFRVWAPKCSRLEVVLDERQVSRRLVDEGDGYFSAHLPEAEPGCLYRLRLDEAPELSSDPASRFQPAGPHGPSMVIDPSTYRWSDHRWSGLERRGQVMYEMHVGSFTAEGTWAAAAEKLEALADLGVTVIEMMPIADFPGRFGWGYDGVNLFAPTRLYGRPDDLRSFIDRAHQVGLGVILDVVYNHVGPDGNVLPRFGPYLSTRHTTDWGPALDFDNPRVRELVIANAGYWIDEYHFDGLRIDATQDLRDDSPRHILVDIARRVREVAGDRGTLLVAENEPQDTRLVRPIEGGGYGLDMMWNDDFHHTAMVALTGRSEAYYSDYRGSAQEFVSVTRHGFLYQGQVYSWQGKRRGTPTRGLGTEQLVNYFQNHDQIANSGHGRRAHKLCSPGHYRAMTALLLLMPGTPLLFQGQEFGASAPFYYFANQRDEIAGMVAEGRAQFLAQFRSLAVPEIQRALPDPGNPETFVHCKLDHNERTTHNSMYALHRDLLRVRRQDPAIAAPDEVDGAVLSDACFVLRYRSDRGDRLLVINLGRDIHLNPAPEPLLAPPLDATWAIAWSSEDLAYGGDGTAPLDTDDNWKIPGQAAVLLSPSERGAHGSPLR